MHHYRHQHKRYWLGGASLLFALKPGRATSAALLFCCVLLSTRWKPATSADTSVIAFTLPQNIDGGAGNEESSGYFPLSKALTSVMQLAADDINSGEFSSLTDGNLTLSVVEVSTKTRAMEGFCSALETIGGNGTFGVRTTLALYYTIDKLSARRECYNSRRVMNVELY